jgi:hypothetical protein
MATNGYGFTYPLGDDQADGSGAMKALADSIGPYSTMRFANASARDAFLTSPVEGMQAWLNDVNYLTFYDGSTWQALGLWKAYTPTWASSGTQPVIGNGTITANYCLIGAKAVGFHILLQAGTTTTQGTGNQTLTLPFAAANVLEHGILFKLWTGTINYLGYAWLSGGSNVAVLQVPTAAANCGLTYLTNTTFNTGTGGNMSLSGLYEAI